ncbi:hypothetical protein PG990_000675 [Apiospora arundinis]
MDWLRSDPYISDRDTKVLKFKPGYNKVLLISKGNQERNTLHETWELRNDSEWSEWLDEYEHDSVHWSDGVCVTLAGRADSIWQDHSVLSNMPFSRGIFNKITNMFWVHSSIVRVINRNTNAHCSAEVGAWGTEPLKQLYTTVVPLRPGLATSPSAQPIYPKGGSPSLFSMDVMPRLART